MGSTAGTGGAVPGTAGAGGPAAPAAGELVDVRRRLDRLERTAADLDARLDESAGAGPGGPPGAPG